MLLTLQTRGPGGLIEVRPEAWLMSGSSRKHRALVPQAIGEGHSI